MGKKRIQNVSAMDRVDLPNSPLNLSLICLGCGPFGTGIPREDAWKLLDAFVECGGDFVDTAHIYQAWLPGGAGASERTIGSWMSRNGIRDKIRVGTKGGHPHLDTMDVSRLSPEEIERDLTESLARLRTDYIDLYWLHRDDSSIPVGEIMDMLDVHLSAGRIRAIGASNWTPQRLREANNYAKQKGIPGFCASQIAWSLAQLKKDPNAPADTLDMDEETYAFHEETGMPVIPFSSQARGFFSGNYRKGMALETPRARQVANLYFSDENFKRLERVSELAKETARTPNQIALTWLRSHNFPVIPIAGCRTIEQIKDTCAAGSGRLDSLVRPLRFKAP